MDGIIECVPNFSEGRRPEIIEKIVDSVRGVEGVQLLDYSSDEDHNRTVVTLVGSAGPLKTALHAMFERVLELIDLRNHKGGHPRMGAIDVVPFIPVRNVSMEDCAKLAEEFGKEVWEKYQIPVYLYEDAARKKERKNLSKVREGQFEGFAEKIKKPDWAPDIGEPKLHESFGAVAIGARMFLIAYNVNLGTNDIEIANTIARAVRHISGGLRFCKGMGVELKERGIVQVSMNLVNYKKTPIYRVQELIKIEAARYGVPVVGTELVGLMPMDALFETAAYYLQLENPNVEQILESRL